MRIWVDADACPKAIKEILYRVADRTKTSLIFVTNQRLALPASPFITLTQVPAGPDIADDAIVTQCTPADLVITADIPLAARIVEKGAFALNPSGKLYDRENIKQILSMRDFTDSLRGSGIETGGPASPGQRERNLFANQLDQIITSYQRRIPKN
jgi:uncharacterized protein YaiI (UPF0178 family)